MCIYAKKSSKQIVLKSKPIIGYKIFLLSGKKKFYSAYRFMEEFANDKLMVYYKDKEYHAIPKDGEKFICYLNKDYYHFEAGFFFFFRYKKDAISRCVDKSLAQTYLRKHVVAKCAFWDMSFYGKQGIYTLGINSDEPIGASKQMKILEIIYK